ncbi:MAG: hypothetical protein RL693_2566 [Verrucomicrobiota bacterium]|jgi:thiamine biosynthesis lipoprotein
MGKKTEALRLSIPLSLLCSFASLRQIALGIAFPLILLSCHAPSNMELQGPTMGTTWHATFAPQNVADEKALQHLIQSRLNELEALFSNWRSDSTISRFNDSPSTDWQSVPREVAEVVTFAQELSRETHGAFDVTISPLIDLWGFGAKGRIKTPPGDQAIAETKSRCGWQKLEVRLDPPGLRKTEATLQINVSALVEGYASDDLVRRLRAKGIDNFLLDIGGELYACGTKADGSPWQVGIQQPDAEKDRIVTAMPLQNQALATSGTYRQYFESNGKHYAHVLDGRKGYPVAHDLVSVSATADSCFKADGWATALLTLTPEEGKALATRRAVTAFFLTKPLTSR